MSIQKRLSSGEFVVLAEMDTPKGVDISELVTNARRVKGRVDAVVIPDMANGVMRMSSLGGGVLMQQQGLEAVIHICPRDRNRLALQGDLLSAHLLGLQNIIMVPGEDIALGDHPQAAIVNDLDEIGLLEAARSLKNGTDLAGLDLKGAPSFSIGAALNLYTDDPSMDTELEAARKKVEAGAEYLIHPMVFDIDRFSGFMKKVSGIGVPVLASVLLLKSVGVARYMNTNIPGVNIHEDTIRRIRKAPDRVMECAKIAGETIQALKSIAQGVVIQSLGWENRLPNILDAAGM